MLLREFKVEGHTVMLNQDEHLYIAQIINQKGEKVFYHEYNDYDIIKVYFDEIVKNIQAGNADIKGIIDILERSTI